MNIKLLGAVAIATTTLAGSAMAQAVINNPARCSAQFPNANCQNLGQGNPYTDRGYRHRRMSYRQTNSGDWNNDWSRSRTGFWPTDVAAGVAGAAIGTAGAIATAPFRAWDNSYAYDNSWDNRRWDTRTYAQRNGFVCTPGTWFKGEDGRRHMCQ
ncbi:hypothetical protein IVB14_23255 [Bradyrhizobium sp. 180]|uniref:hypothetical protein n=1 Tax=unclassified Bradyrhizobium TaxID=2631580 RepID=UPI001FF9F04E|nr:MULTISPECIES: hypothetical protein [unclassified Bradyrhizobium]MCK1424609.1 hypothetical protein [Bradyrhizobium sp. CW12]MCK1493269.1 hypothetical protein [Bradyrhizobium sp. 180]MCK1528997.1 hypothetical protein [Bradyrhizobium sp. 182]MCK1595860.1 hypothetical protein [Bradyrhizobium sp. 164]MCK1618069.1 hypothetical protein [Bradyrhizobium sp. 159]